VLRFPDDMQVATERLKVPQMGWNQLHFKRRPPAFEGISEGSNVYFVHSYYTQPDHEDVIATTTEYGIEFCSSVWKDNIVATQFHPEKSQDVGLRILKNFAEQK
jgi:glutamine amidotransferase